jgi:thymidylate synthase ThyX
LNVRCDSHAQKEVRDIATRIGEELEKELPEIMSTIDWRNGMFM